MPKTRRLSDLYVRGRELEIDDGEGAVKIWLAKLNAVDRDAVFRRAQAAKARYMIDGDNEDGDAFIEEYGRVRDFGDRESLTLLAVAEDIQKFQERVEAELAADENSWGKDGYLQGLVDAWRGTDTEPGLSTTIEEDPNDPEALRVQAEIDRFGTEVAKRTDDERARLVAEWDDVPDEDLFRKVTHVMLQTRAVDRFVTEVMRQQVFFMVRELDHKTRYFGTLQEVDDLDDRVREQLYTAVNELMVDTKEGKDSPVTPDSSPPSESPDEAEEAEPSGPEAVST